MAAIILSYTLRDAKDQKSIVEIPIPGTTLVTDLLGALDGFGQLIDDITSGGLVEAVIRLVGTVTDWGSSADPASDVQEKALFTFNNPGPIAKTLNVPTILESVFETASVDVDQDDVAVAAFIDGMVDGITVNAHTVAPCTIHEDDLTGTLRAVENWGKRRK